MGNSDLRRFGPKPTDFVPGPRDCPACKTPFAAGDFTTIVPLGPGSDPEERLKARNGLTYNAVAVEVHWACATGEEQER